MKRILNSFFGLGLCLASTAFLSSCGSTESIENKSISVEVIASGPLFEGSNTATGTYEVNLSELTGIPDFDVSNLKNVTIESAALKTSSDLITAGISQIGLSLTSKNADMQQVAFANEEQIIGNQATFKLATELKDLAKYFQDDKLTIVTDMILQDDVEEDFTGTILITLNLEIKK
jgi:hypothetical protein